MPRRARVSAQEGPRLPDGTFTPRPGSPYYTKHSEYRSGGAWDPAKRKPRKARKARKSGSGVRRGSARLSKKQRAALRGINRIAASVGRRKGRARRAGLRTGARVTSKSGRTYKKTKSGNWSLVRGKKSGGRKRKSSRRRSRR